jgi:hypothetical protein
MVSVREPASDLMGAGRQATLLVGLLLLCGLGYRSGSTQEVRTTTRVRIRAGPSISDSILRILPIHSAASLSEPGSSSGGFFHVQTASGLEGWIHGHYLVPASGVSGPALMGVTAGTGYPVCGGAHYYRWAVKKDHSGIPTNGSHISIATILEWSAGDLGRELGSWCADRGGRELRSFSVVGWVRRVRKHEGDGDWHVELTATEAAPVRSCVIVEIPDPSFGDEYGSARSKLDQLLVAASIDPDNGDVSPSVRVRFTGPAFYDGWHRTSRDHGRCNSTPGAIWELHPVVAVGPP